ncbi:head maturation protease, ClpP-related [Brevibacillus aydinogluensis]|uniref:ATP-dependent Clp protease proteolytic subunit n=1 Tax=Brevibacillus aydinogluensis TaxID=927786 RepID=A0AA48M9S3_9BACL|nr:ATP-dependent Clp protease proteolytic subunit [Brevibacillus aydinogluensis]
MPSKIEIRGVIIPNDYQWIYDWFEIEATSPGKVNQLIQEANGDDLEVIINSGGGDVFSGSEIYTALKDYPGNVTVKIIGVAASAASVIAMGGKKVMMSPTAQLMIHNASTSTWGDKRDHRHAAEFLQTIDASIANAYRLKTGMSQNELLTLMNKETWMNAQDALEKGFIDEIMFDDGNQLRAVASLQAEFIPQKVIEKLRNEIFRKKGENQMEKLTQMAAQGTAPQSSASMSTEQPPQVITTASTAAPAPQAAMSADAVSKERERLRAIDEIAANIDPALVNEAKYGANPMTAEELAFRAMKEGKLMNAGLFEAAVAANKSAGTDNVQAQMQPQAAEKEFDLNNIRDVNEVFRNIAAMSFGRHQ